MLIENEFVKLARPGLVRTIDGQITDTYMLTIVLKICGHILEAENLQAEMKINVSKKLHSHLYPGQRQLTPKLFGSPLAND